MQLAQEVLSLVMEYMCWLKALMLLAAGITLVGLGLLLGLVPGSSILLMVCSVLLGGVLLDRFILVFAWLLWSKYFE